MSEIPRPMRVDPVIRTMSHRKPKNKVESSDVDDALVARRVQLRNNLRSWLARALGVNRKSALDIWKEEWDRVDERAVELLMNEVVTDLEEAKRIAYDERFRMNSLYIDFDERAKSVGEEVLRCLSCKKIKDSRSSYDEEMAKPDLMEVGCELVKRESVRAVRMGIAELINEGNAFYAREAFYEWLGVVKVNMKDLRQLHVVPENMDKFKKALLYDLATALQTHPHIYILKRDEIKSSGFLTEGEIVFSEEIREAVKGELSKALARNEEYFEQLREYFEEEGLVGACVNVEPDKWEQWRPEARVRENYAVAWEDFLMHNPYFKEKYEKGFELK